uniref:LIM zinc-binding domain-containing protein n=1 Tax=Panagrolaimus superbus TaxID=310955 RepID=A0A914YAD4_9BILA
MVTSGLHYCMNCYHLASRCNTCRKYIIADKPHVTQNNIHWHADERCFCCGICERNLLGKKRYTFIDGMLLCGSEACARSHELRRHPPPPSSSSQKFCHLQRAGSLSSVPPGSSSPSMGSLTPSGSASPAHSDRPISRRKEYHLQNLPPVQKSPSRVRFDLRPQKQQTIIGPPPPLIPETFSRPKPPPSNPPPPPPNIPNALTPPENIYETVIMPSQISSSSSQEFNRSDNIKRSKRRSKRKTTPSNHNIGEENNDYIVSSESSDSDNPTEALPSSSTGSNSKYRSTNVCSPVRSSSADCRYHSGEASRSCRRNNHYSNPPPEGCEKRCNSCTSSSSESDADDVYLSHYLAASLSRPESLKSQNKAKMSPFLGKKQRHRAIPTIATPKTAKNKKSSNSNCIVS